MSFDTHYTILGASLWGLENLANLQSLIGQEAYLVAGIPRFEQGSGGPGRVLALLSGGDWMK